MSRRPHRHLHLFTPGTQLRVNFRDVADTVKVLRKGKLFRSSVCFTPTSEIRAMVDLRRKGAEVEPWHEEGMRASSREIKRHHIPMVGSRGGLSLLTQLPATTFVKFCLSGGSEAIVGTYYFATPDNIVDMYVRIAENASHELTEIAKILADPSEGGTVIFCVAGKDRTGIVISLFSRLCGASIEEIAADYTVSQKNLAQAKEEGHLALVDPLLLDSCLTQSPWEAVVAFIRTIETRYGSVRTFFKTKLRMSDVLIDAVIQNLKDPNSQAASQQQLEVQ